MTKQRKKRLFIWCLVAVLAAAVVIWIAWGNTALELNTYTVSSEKLPEAFNGFRIAHVSDLHNTEIGKDNETLLEMLKQAEPDIIAITGDMIDARNTDMDIALHFAMEAMKIAPCYYVTGNHEARIAEYEKFREPLSELGVVILEDENVMIEREGETIELVGIDDPSFDIDYLLGDSVAAVRSKFEKLEFEGESFTVLLSHRPELFEIYSEYNLDLVLSGHAHGGQFRLPLLGGLIAPNQGLFPKYDAGLYAEDTTSMIVSRGIGNSAFPFRFNNRPEVILIELSSQ